MKTNKDKLYRIASVVVVSAIFLTAIIIIIMQYQEDQEIKRYRRTTLAQVIEFKHINLTRYYIKYKYKVEGKEYTGRTGVEHFKCDDGALGCVGHTFKVIYSRKNPSKSNIDLGKYEKYERTVEF